MYYSQTKLRHDISYLNFSNGSHWARISRILIAPLIIVFSLTSCTPQVDVRGYISDTEQLNTIVEGTHMREDVWQLLGSPTSESAFDGRTWYYMSRRTQGKVFEDDKVIEQDVIAIVFDDRWIVKEIHHYGIDDGRIVNLVTRKTPTRGNELGLIEQFFGNIGRFNAPTGAAGD